MIYSNQPSPITARNLMIALSEVFPDSTYGAIPVIDQRDALEEFFAYDYDLGGRLRTTTILLLGDKKHEHANR